MSNMDFNQNSEDVSKSSQNSDSPAHLIEKIIIGSNDNENKCDDENYSIFSELSVLHIQNGNYVWKETARWIKYEEDVEEGGNRWSKPHVSTISLHSLLELRSCLLNGVVILNCRADNLEQIVEAFINALLLKGEVTSDQANLVREVILQKHHHQYQKSDSKARLLMRSLADMRNNSNNSLFRSNSKLNVQPSDTALNRVASASNLNRENQGSGQQLQAISRGGSCNELGVKFNEAFMRKIPAGTETNNILIAEVPFLDRPISGFIRLSTACSLGHITEVAIPTKFLFISMGPHRYTGKYYQVGRAFGTLMSDQVFNLVALKSQNRDILLAGVDEYLDAVTILPPGVWDPNIRIEPPEHTPTHESRKLQSHHSIDPEIPAKDSESVSDDEEEIEREKNGLTYSGRLFGGLVNDIKRKVPFYWSDFRDALSLQSLASVAFLYFACLSPIITFGGLLGDATGNHIATMESLMSGAVCGIIYGFFSGQPLTILGSTGPVLVFETIIYDFCRTYGIVYLSLRLWIGLWTAAILIIMVAFDASAFVCYITRFTEENFATLISVIFIYKAIEKLFEIQTTFPMNRNINSELNYNCWCVYPENSTESVLLQESKPNSTALEYCLSSSGNLSGPGCWTPVYKSDVFLLSVILLFATYVLSVTLKEFRTKSFLPTKYRHIISDFAVPIAIISVTIFDNWVGLQTPKLLVPSNFKPTVNRNWFVPPFVEENSIWLSVAAVIPALLATILCFMDQQITAVIVNRKENKLKKGCGYHLDLFILAILIAICSIFGLPWFVAATVLSMTHVKSLEMVSQTAAPGDKPQFLGVREQRVTHILIFVFCGLSIFFTNVLQRIPMPVLYGVFLYMGTSSLRGSQFFERILILLMPQKYQPDYIFLRQVRTSRVHLFTLIQLMCFAMLWIVKSYKTTSIAFPVMLVVMILIRKVLDCVFTREELKVLDDIMPESTKRKRHEEKEKINKKQKELTEAKLKEQLRNERIRRQSGNLEIPLANGNILKIETNKNGPNFDKQINTIEQISKSSVWKSINGQHFCNGSKLKVNENDAQNEDEKIALNQLNGGIDKENECGITIRIN